MLPSQGKPKKLVGLFLLCAFLFISFLTTSAAEGATGERERAAAMSAIITQLLLSDAPLARVSDRAWDETAVRKVLQTFSYGGSPGTVRSLCGPICAPRMPLLRS
jgi:hypothetical protein